MLGQKRILFLLTGVILLVTILVTISLLSPKRTSPLPTPQPIFIPTAPPIPSTPPLPTPVSNNQKITTREELINLLPVTSDGFKVEYFSASDTILVTITSSPLKENTAKSEGWLNDLGITDFKKFNIVWVSSPYVY